ncbi:hypothetical protein EDB80DRAFT_725047 [Ilyonectria destructans]|nr:hypothetical protein EDB80DRAFT_725047 [Ilyonectria destructans]
MFRIAFLLILWIVSDAIYQDNRTPRYQDQYQDQYQELDQVPNVKMSNAKIPRPMPTCKMQYHHAKMPLYLDLLQVAAPSAAKDASPDNRRLHANSRIPPEVRGYLFSGRSRVLFPHLRISHHSPRNRWVSGVVPRKWPSRIRGFIQIEHRVGGICSNSPKYLVMCQTYSRSQDGIGPIN